MNSTIINSVLAVSLTAATFAFPATSMQAEIHSKSKDLVVMEPRDLPEQAQARGNSLLLHSDNSGSTYLYVEQEQGTRLSVFDVTDPARIKLTVSTALPAEGAFDFIRPLGDNAELVYFRSGQKEGILDLHKAKRPVLSTLSIATNLDAAEPLGQSGFLATIQPYEYIPAVSRDFQVIDISSASPTPLATFTEVRHQLTNRDTGTTFLLGSGGLTVIRRISVEEDYKAHQMWVQSN
jgi:hypothetical protein